MVAGALAHVALLLSLILSSSKGDVVDPVSIRYAWSAPTDCRREAIVVDVTRRHALVQGRVEHRGKEPIRDVTICFGRACTKIDGVMIDGRSVRFEVHGGSRVKPTVRCSILEERVGA